MSTKKPSSFAALFDIDKKRQQKELAPPSVVIPSQLVVPVIEPQEKLNEKANLRSADQIKTMVQQNLVPIELSSGNQVPIEPSSNSPKLTELSSNSSMPIELSSNRTISSQAQPIRYFMLPNAVADEIFPTLEAYEQIVFFRLLRLSFGFNKTITDHVSLSKLATKTNLSVSTVKRSLEKLEAKKIIKVISEGNHNPTKGNRYEITINYSPIELSSNSSKLTGHSSIETKFPQTSIKDHDHDFKNTDHHQRETMTFYQELTGNSWTKKDEMVYEKVKDIPTDQIKAIMRQVMDRASQKPATLAYFVKEILSPTLPNSGSRSARRAQMERIINQVRDANRHRNGYLISEWSADTKEECARQGVAFDNDLFNEIVDRKS